MIEDQEEKRKLESEYNINRGFELMLRRASRKKVSQKNQKKFQIKFAKTFSLFGLEVSFDFDFSFDFKKYSNRIKK
jgi:hypothetical protein